MISIVIRTLDEERYLDELLAACGRQQVEGHEVEVVIVDSGSTDATLEIAKAHDARITHIDKAEFSFGRSLNVGCDFADGEVLVFVSGHCIPTDPGWLDALCRPLLDGVAQYSYGRQVGRDRTKFSERQLFEKYFPAVSAIPQQGFFCNNANAAVRRDVWAHHRFDEDLTGLEDMALAKRLVDEGGSVAYVADAVVFHVHDESWTQVRRRYEREAIALQQIMPAAELRAPDVPRMVCAGILNDMASALRQRRLLREISGIVKFRIMQYVGSYVGWHEHRLTARQLRDVYYYPST